ERRCGSGYHMHCGGFLDGHASSLTWKPKVSKPSYKVPSASRGEIRFAYYIILEFSASEF
ncbi:MAG: hypothetical protein KGJ58_04630, partial [Patescibacteria group bacterium]|nr:hypothetical protein [Patescibacteria group bacterium]